MEEFWVESILFKRDKGKCPWVYQVLVRLNPLLFRERAKLRRYTLTQLLEKQRKFHICTFDHKISHYVGMKDEDVHVRTVGKAQARFQLQTVWLQEWSFFPLSHASSLKTRSWFVEGFFFNVLFTFSNLKKKNTRVYFLASEPRNAFDCSPSWQHHLII